MKSILSLKEFRVPPLREEYDDCLHFHLIRMDSKESLKASEI